MAYERSFCAEDLDAFKIGGTTAQKCDTMEVYRIGKGGGSAFGGEWRPSKPEDERFVGAPGEIKTSYTKDGIKIETKIGQDGRAIAERHYTNHNSPKFHSNPHDHHINWVTPRYGIPNFEKPHINYWPDEYPEGVPAFKALGGAYMNYRNNSEEENRFKTISEFKECLIRGGEIEFQWKGTAYSVGGYDKYVICVSNQEATEKICDTPDEVLAYLVGEDCLRDVITQVTVVWRSI